MTKSELKLLIQECIKEINESSIDEEMPTCIFEEVIDEDYFTEGANPEKSDRKAMIKKALSVIKDFAREFGYTRDLIFTSRGSKNKAFINGKSDTFSILFTSNSDLASALNGGSARTDRGDANVRDFLKSLRSEKSDVEKSISEAIGKKCTVLGGTTDIKVTVKF